MRTKAILIPVMLLSLLIGLGERSMGQPPGGGGRQGGFGGLLGGGPPPGGPNSPDLKLVEKYDADGNGRLNDVERAKAREEVKGRSSGRGGRQPRGNAGGGSPGERVNPEDVMKYSTEGLYDQSILRTIFLNFENEDWEQELADFKPTDVDVPATMIVDGKLYKDVGVGFRGASSFFMIPAGLKRSFNISMDYAEKDQRLHGVKTLNLLNCNGDASMLSTVLYSNIASHRMAAPKANLVKVVVNGESWGIYCNVEQFNKDFVKSNYGTPEGARWKVSGSPRGDGGLRYLGEDFEPYRERFEIKSKDDEESWKALINLCRVLNETPIEELESALDPILDIDGALWFLAVDVALVNSDGYWTRASDYSIYLDPNGRFRILPHDMNESFRGSRGGRGGRGGGPGGGGPGGGPPGFGGPPGGGPPGFGPPPGDEPPGFGGRPQGGRPEGGRPEGGRPEGAGGFGGQQGFGQQGRGGGGQQGRGGFGRRGGRGGPGGGGGGPGGGGTTLDPLVGLTDESKPLRSRLLANEKLRNRYLQHVRFIAEELLTWKSLGPTVTGTRKLIGSEVQKDTRKLSTYEAFMAATAPDKPEAGQPGESLRAFAETRAQFLLNHEAIKGLGRREIQLSQGSVAIKRDSKVGSLSRVDFPVVINEVMASNLSTVKGPSGQYEDWIELKNLSQRPVDLSGVFLSDDSNEPFKWAFPEGTRIAAGGFLVVWADEDDDGTKGLHASFKLSKKGEHLYLTNRDGIIDDFAFGKQTDDQSFGRISSGLKLLSPTPNAENAVPQ